MLVGDTGYCWCTRASGSRRQSHPLIISISLQINCKLEAFSTTNAPSVQVISISHPEQDPAVAAWSKHTGAPALNLFNSFCAMPVRDVPSHASNRKHNTFHERQDPCSDQNRNHSRPHTAVQMSCTCTRIASIDHESPSRHVHGRKLIAASSIRNAQLTVSRLAALPLDTDWTMAGTSNTTTRLSHLRLVFTGTATRRLSE